MGVGTLRAHNPRQVVVVREDKLIYLSIYMGFDLGFRLLGSARTRCARSVPDSGAALRRFLARVGVTPERRRP